MKRKNTGVRRRDGKATCGRHLLVFVTVLIVTSLFFSADTQQAAAQNPDEIVFNAIGTVCLGLVDHQTELNDPQKDLLARCSEVVGGTDFEYENAAPDQLASLPQINSKQTDTMGTITIEITGAQIATVLGRLETLRGGGPAGLAMDIQDQRIPKNLFAGPITYLASADDAAMEAGSSPDMGPMGNFGRIGFFVNGSFSTGDKDATNLEPGFDFDIYDVTLGADYRCTSNLIVGVAFGYSKVETDVDLSDSEINSDGYGISLYGTYYLGDFYVDAIGAYGKKDYDTIRNSRYTIKEAGSDEATTMIDQTFLGDTDADELSFSAGVGYDFNTQGFTVGPHVRLNYASSEVDGYTEKLRDFNTDAGYGMALEIFDQDIESLRSVLGAQLSYAASTGIGVLMPLLSLDWVHEFKNDARNIRARFVNEVAGQNEIFNIPTDSPDRNFLILGAGLSAVFPHGISAFVHYETPLELEDVTYHQFTGGVRFEF